MSLKLTPVSATDTMTQVHLAFVTPTQLPIDTPVQAEIVIEERKDAIVAPADALQRADGTTFFWVPNENNQATRREVRIGLLVGNTVQILTGLDGRRARDRHRYRRALGRRADFLRQGMNPLRSDGREGALVRARVLRVLPKTNLHALHTSC